MKKAKHQQQHTKFENEWLHSTIEQLEKDKWGEPTFNSYLVTTCHALRKKPLKDFETEDLRIMIGQNIGLKYLVPLALKTLSENILAEGHFYEGDLLKMVLTSEASYWQSEVKNWKTMCELFEQNRALLENMDTTREIRKGWFDAYEAFEKINIYRNK